MLPLKETVVFPEAVAPLAVGEERSIRLIDEVLNGPDRLLALVVSRDPEVSAPGPDQLHEIGTVAVVQRMVRVPDGTVRILAQGLRRVRLGPYTQTEPFLVAHVEEVPDHAERTTEVEALTRNLQSIFSRMIELVPHLPDELQIAVANMEDPTTLSYVIAASMRLSTEERQELLEESDLAARLRRLTVLATRELELLELGAKIQSDVRLDLDKGQREFFLRQQLKAIREELGEGDDEQAEIEELRAPARRGRSPRAGAHGRRARAVAPRAPAPGVGRVRRGEDLPRLDPLAALEHGHRGRPGPDAGTGRARRGPLRHREGEGPHHRAPGRGAAEERRRGPDPVLRGPPGGRQDVAGPVDRAGPGAALRADLGGRGARRGGDPRPPAHLRGRDARHDRARHPRRRGHEPGDHGGRDRQDGLRLPGRSRLGDARGAGPGPERDLPGPLPRPAARPVTGALPVHGQRARHDPARAARPDGDDPALGLHRGGEAPHRPALPPAPPDRGGGAPRGDAGGDRRRPPDRDRRVHPGGRGAAARAPSGGDRPAHRGAGGRGGRGPRGRGRRRSSGRSWGPSASTTR